MKAGETITNVQQHFEEIGQHYVAFQRELNFIDFNEIIQFSNSFKEYCSELLLENRKLRIGIIGQMKVGKSSFLNAFLFDGKEILPKAATPMTAALTVISYDDRPGAEVEFFSKEDWDIIADKANRCQKIIDEYRNRMIQTESREPTEKEINLKIPVEFMTSKELVREALKLNNFQELLGTSITINGLTSIDELQGKLSDYVGVDGRYTPLVKDLRLYFDFPSLKDLEIIDTPGINDPIISRGMKTRDFLGKCDAVFFLSYSGQFIDSCDLGLLAQNLPGKGIAYIVMIGSMFDSVLLDEGDKYRNLKSAVLGISQELTKKAEQTIRPILQQNPDFTILHNLEKSLKPSFISAMAFNIAKHYPNLNPEEEHILNQLKNRFLNDQFTPELLFNLSNIDHIHQDIFPKIIDQKDQIIKERFELFLEGQRYELKEKLNGLLQNLKADLTKLASSDLQTLKKQKKQNESTIKKIDQKIDGVFNTYITGIYQKLSQIISQLKKAATQIDVSESSSTREVFDHTKGINFLWFKKRKVYREERYTYAEVSQAINNIKEFVIEAEANLNDEIIHIIDRKELEKEIKKVIQGALDIAFSDENFDLNDILIPVNKVINKISVPTVDLDSYQYIQIIRKEFSQAKVEGNDINKLKVTQEDTIRKILREISDKISDKKEEIKVNLEKTAKDFIGNVIEQSNERLEDLIAQINKREEAISKYERAIQTITGDIEKLGL